MQPESNEPTQAYDVVILGGGLAGLCQALQLRQTLPDCSVLVIEKNEHPVPEAAHKVGESTVELAAHYFSEVLGLSAHLRTDQLPKFGLRFFFGAGDNSRIENRLEVGAVEFPPTGSFQLDRGRFENYLGAHCRDAGVTFIDGARVREAVLSSDESHHEVRFSNRGTQQRVFGRWVVDASGRAGILKHQLKLAKESAHKANAVWFRLDCMINMDEWSDAPEYKRFDGKRLTRWFSTNHLMGPGYWVWVIPLASNSTSVGIVADAAMHPLSTYNNFERALEWLRRHEPLCASVVEEKQHLLQDFKALKHYSHDCAQVYSARRWCLTGEAGVFLDPFYSPGSDFIALSNSFICDLIRRDLKRETIIPHVQFYNDLYLSFFRNTALLFQDQYPVFGNPQVMPLKIAWDFATYWAFLAYLFYQNRLCCFESFRDIRERLERIGMLNSRMQQFFREWNATDTPIEAKGLVDLFSIDCLRQLNCGLKERLGDDDYRRQLDRNIEVLEQLSREMVARARESGRYGGELVAEAAGSYPHLGRFFKGIGL